MNRLPPRPVQAFFLVDRSSKSMSDIEANLKRFITEFPKIEAKIFTIEAVARPINQAKVYCDLSETLALIYPEIKGTHRVEIFLFLKNEPQQGWKNGIEKLRTNRHIRMTVFDFISSSINLENNLDEMSVGWGNTKVSFKLTGTKYEKKEKSFNIIRKCLHDYEKKLLPKDFQSPNPNQVTELVPDEPTKKDENMPEITEKEQSIAIETQGKWQVIEPPADLSDRVEHVDKLHLAAKNDWHLIGASRRGKMHEHNGSFREDAFALAATENDWHIMVVADGGGSCSLSRVGSNVAANTSVNVMKDEVIRAEDFTKWSEAEIIQFCEKTLQKGMEKAWFALEQESIDRKIDFKEFGTTFLALMHYCGDDKHIVGVLQVGDGIVAAQYADKKIAVLADPDIGQSASVTLFLTSKRWETWLDRVKVQALPAAPRLLAAMCDGVSDDFIPYNTVLWQLFGALEQQVIKQPNPEEILLNKVLTYPKKGSFDDRTLTLIYHLESDQTTEPIHVSEPEQAPELDPEAAATLLDETPQP